MCFFWVSISNAQTWYADTIHVNINSGNPAFPFPQFLEYKAGKSLAANNAVGVTHADMEKAMREGYEIMMHRSLYTGAVLNDPITGKSVRYIYYNYIGTPNPGYEPWVSEGDGYALIAAAYFGDKATFDGIWCAMHDARMSVITRYIDCQPQRMNYPYGPGTVGWKNGDNDAAPDGDFDIAMGLFLAYKQWGPDMGINDKCGKMISYEDELKKYLKTITDTVFFDDKSCTGPGNIPPCNPRTINNGGMGYYTGDIGFDGFIKGANTVTEFTNWAKTNGSGGFFSPETYARYNPWGTNVNGSKMFTDYIAPSYFNEFAAFLQAEDPVAFRWNIHQFKRAEASSDWIVKQMYDQGYILSSGKADFNEATKTVTFGNYNIGEDFRLSWRTTLNYLWHGNSTTSFNINTRQVDAIANTYEKDMAIRHADFLKFPRTLPSAQSATECTVLGASPDRACPLWKGVSQIKQTYTINGTPLAGAAAYRTNYALGTGVTTAVASEDLDLTAELYRQCEIMWDDAEVKASGMSDDGRYIRSTPIYFHDWFRLLGMLTASGNLHAPADVKAGANMKVYMAVDKTFAYEGDLITYTIDYRNYGSLAAAGVKIVTTLDTDYQLVSAIGGAVSGNTITWNIGTVAGFKSGALAATKGKLTFVVRVKAAPVHARVCLTSTITATNAPSWTSNEYPNNASYTMERNCVDLLKDRILAIEKTTDRSVMNPGDIVNFTLNFENKTGSNLWLNGGRDRVVISYANHYPNNGTSFYQFYRIWHTAHEAYIDLGNYRVSYFINDPAAIGKYNATTNPTGWDTYVDNQSDLNKYGYNPTSLPANKQLRFSYEKIPWGSDANGSWNQRVVTQFASVLSSPSSHIFDKLDHQDYIHKGVVGPGFTRTRFESKPSSILGSRLQDDWSYSIAVDNASLDGQEARFFPISPTYTNAVTNFAPVVVNNYSKDICNPDVDKNYDRVLVEEFDGYTWRRIAGRGPLPGRETYNVVVTDSIPIELAWSAFTDDLAVGVTATYTALSGNPKFSGYVKWTIPVMMVGEKGDLSYKTIAKTPVPVCVDKEFVNTGWIWSDVDSPDSSTVKLKLSCNAVPPTPPVETSLVKTADKTNVVVGDIINYTLTYTNKDGSKAAWNNTSTLASDWQALGLNTTIPDITGSTFTINNNNTSVDAGTNGFAFGHRKSHGKNGYTDITFTTYDKGTFSLIFRNTVGTTPAQPGFQGVRLEIIPSNPNVINFKVYNNNTLLQDIPNVAYPGSITSIKLRTQLVDDKLYIWINDFTGAPIKVISGITNLNPGYAGIFSAGSAEQVFTAYTTHWDSAFDLVLTDPVPVQLNNVTNISHTGALVGSTVTWPTVPGPILANAIITRTFTATVNTCTNFITNIGKASVYGVTNIQSQYVVTCGSVTPCIPPTTPVITVNQTICTGTAPALIGGAALAGGSATGTASYVWETSINGTTGWTAVSTATLKDYTPAALTATAYYRRTDSKGGCSSLPSNVITITVTPLAIAGTIAADQTICAGTIPTALTGSVSTGGVTIKNYKWQSSLTGLAPWTQVAAYSTTGTGFAPAALTATTHYRRIDSSGVCAGVPTDTIVITVTPAVTAGTISTAQTICSGATPTALTGTVSTGGVTVKNYKWQSSPTGLTGSWLPAAAYSPTGTGFAPGTLTADTYYRRIDSSGVCAGIATNTIKITVTPTIVPSVSIATPSTTICTGASITLTATPTNGGTPTYQWYKGTAPSGVSLGATATNATYTTTTAANNDSYYVIMTSTAACASPVASTSNAVVITVTTAVTPAVTITAVPGNTICAGTSVTFTAVGGNGGLAPTYEWFVKKTTDVTPQSQGAASSAAGADKFTSTTLESGDEVRVIMTSNSGCVVAPGTAASNVIAMTVNPNVTPSVAIATPSVTICAGESITFTATPTNGGIAMYQWFSGPVAFGPASTNATYTTSSAAVDGDSYYVKMTSNALCASTPSVISNILVIAVTTAATPSVTITAAPDNTICAGESVTFTAVAGNGGAAPTYEWFVKKTTDATPQSQGAAATGATTFTSTTLTNGDEVSVIMTSNSSCVAAPGTALSNVIAMTVNAIPAPSVSIVVDDADQTICPNASITFTATPTNGGILPKYQWKKGGVDISGETNATYTTTAALDGEIYTVEMISNELCAPATPSTSNPITITVTLAPTIAVSVNPGITSICANNPVQFTATASGAGATPAPTYEWFVTSASTATGGSSQGTPSTTATTFTTSALTATNNKVYVQVVSNAPCAAATAVASNVVSITVNTGIGAGTIGSDQTICYNTPASAFTELTASDAVTPTYVWEASTSSGGTYIPIPGATNTTYSPPAVGLTQDLYLHRIVTDGSVTGTCNNATSNEVHIKVNPQLAAGVIGSDQTLCSGIVPGVMTETTAPTGGTGTYTYQWQSDAAAVGVFADMSGATNSSYTSAALTRTTKFQRIETSGTCGSVTSNIVEKTITTPEVVSVSLNNPGQVCTGSAAFNFIATASTSGTGTLSYAWSIINPTTLVSTPIGSNSPNDSYSPLIDDHSKLIQVVVTTSNGCNAGPATASVALDIVSAATPTVTIATNDNPNCIGYGTTFTATTTAGGTNPQYQWYTIPFGSSTPQAVGTGGITYTTSTLADGDIVYVSLSSSLSCLIGTNPFKSNEIIMDMKPTPAPSITEGDQTICSPKSFTFHGNVTAGNTYEWRLNNQPTGITTADIRATQNGTYTLIEDNGACNSISQPVTLNVIQTPQANAGTDIYLKEGDEGSLNGSGGAIYSWSPATYLSNAAVGNPSFTATTTITYILTVSDVANPLCATTDDVTVFVVKPIEVPNVITVNGDGSNDDWEIKNIDGYPNVIIEIYNRWGNLVWKSEGYPKNWDGTNFRNGQLLSDGTYFYIINLQSQVYPEPLTGWVQIIK